MFNWNAQMQGAGYPMHPQQMMPFSGMQQSFPPPMAYQGTMAPQNWAQQQHPPAFQTIPPNAIGMMMGQSWMPQAQGMYNAAGYPSDPMSMVGIMGGATPMPPMQPPPEEKPPLPAEPPPPLPNEKPPPPKDQPKPPLPGQSKSKWDQTSKEPTVKWDQISKEPTLNPSYKPGGASSQPQGSMMQNINTSTQAQPTPPHFPPPNQPKPPPEPGVSKKAPPPPDPSLVAELDKVTKEQQIFLEQYRQWKKQYDDWREQNQNHPNKDQFQQYLEQWQTYEQQMEVRRKSIETQKNSLEEKLSKTSFSASSAGTLQQPPDVRVTEDVKSSQWDSAKKEVFPGNAGFFRPSSEREQMLMRSNEQDSSASMKKTEGKEQVSFPGKFIPGNIRDQVSSPSRQVKIPGIGDEDKGEEDMNLDDDENPVGGIIESREQVASNKGWTTGGPPGTSSGPPGSGPGLPNSSSFQNKNANDWNSWNNKPEGPGQWGNETNSFGPPGPDFQGGPRPGPDFWGGSQQGPNFPGGPRLGPDFPGGPKPGPNFPRGPRSGPDFSGGPKPGPNFQRGPRSGPDFQGGPRSGPDFQGGPRPGPDFQGGPRPGLDFGSSSDTDLQGEPGFQGGPRQGPEFFGRPRPGNDFDGGPRPGPNFYGGPRPGPRGRGDWSMRGNGPRFGRGGPAMNDGPRFPGPPKDNIDYQENQVAGDETEINDTEFENDNDYPESQFYNGPFGMDRGRGNLRRGRGDFLRGRGDFHRGGMGGDFQRGGMGGDFQRGGMGGDFPGGRGADFHRGRGSRGDFGRGGRGEFHLGRGGEHQRESGGMFGEGPGSNFFDGEEDGPSRGAHNFRGRGRGQLPPMRGKPPSLLEVNFHESMRERFPDFMGDEQPFDDGSNPRDDDFRPMGRGLGFPEPHDGAELEGLGSHRGRGFPRGRGAVDRGGRGMPRPRGGFNNEQQSFIDDPTEEFSYGPRGRGRGMQRGGRGGGYGGDRFMDSEDSVEEMHHEGFKIRGRGRGAGRGGRGRGGFADSQNVDSFNDDSYSDGFPDEGPFNPRGRGGGVPYGRGRGRGMSTGPWSNEQEMEKPPHLANDAIPDEVESSADLAGPRTMEPPRRGSFEGEPDMKKSRFDQEPPLDIDRRAKMPYPPYPRDPFDPFMDPYSDPYRRYPDPYFRDPYLDPPFAYDRLAYDRYGALPSRFDPERKPFIPTESIDYGHGGVGKEKKSIQPAEVIDYGHGQAVEKKPSDPPLSVIERERAGLKDPELADLQRERKMNRDGSFEWTSGRDYRDPYSDRMSRDMDMRKRDLDGRLGFDSHSFGCGREESRPSGYKSGAPMADEDMRQGHRPDGDPDYKDRLPGEREDYYGARGRYGAREENRRGDYMSRGDDARMEDLYNSRRDDAFVGSEYPRPRDDDVRGGHGFGRDAGLPPRDGYSRDSYSRDDRDMYRGERDRLPRIPSPAPGTPPTSASLTAATSEVVKIEDLLCPPLRLSRPPQIVIIIRGLPGSGKTYVSKLIREKETNYGGSAPRMLCLDDYFMVETDKEATDPDTGKKVKKKAIEYEYEQALEEAYRQSLLKSFKKTVDDGFFPFIILDATNEKVAHFAEFWSYAKSKGFQVYVGELKVDVATCIQRNVHHWTEWDIEKVKNNWEPLPCHYIKLDLRWLLQEASIPEVVMEDTETVVKQPEEKKEGEEDEEEETAKEGGIYVKSKWELDTSEETLDKLDGIRVSKKHILEHQSLNEYLGLDQMDDEYNSRESLPGKKRVRWADLEEKKNQNRRRNLGFIVGQTQQDWDRITDDDFASKALNQTKYFYKS
ncbi:hypothetical protein Btru_018729 [Bulinus truncatus]|nr:hypothetical protein Btru_018729 [Bulinus truncatus]